MFWSFTLCDGPEYYEDREDACLWAWASGKGPLPAGPSSHLSVRVRQV